MRRTVAFITVGAIGFVVQLSSLTVLLSLAHWPWLVATVASVSLTVFHNFVWHERWTWRDRRAAGSRAARFLRFNAGNGLIALAGNTLSMALLAGVLGVPPVPANVITVGLLAAVNFAVADRWTFTRGSRPPHRALAPLAELGPPAIAPAEDTRRQSGW